MTTHKLKTSEIFEVSRRLIAERENIYICSTFQKICLPYGEHRRVKEIIMRLLGGTYTLEGWLSTRIGIPCDELYHKYPNDMRELRLRWLDWIIQTYQEKGD